MLEITYLMIFCFFAVMYIFIKSVKAGEIHVDNSTVQRLTHISTYIKGISAGLASIFVFIMRPDDSLFYLVLVVALLFCLAGDLGMEKGLIPGLPLFLVAQILFSIAFIGQSLTFGVSVDSLIPALLVTLVMAIYLFLFIRYLETSETGLGKFKVPVLVYCIFISLMLVSSILLWFTSGVLEFGVSVLGGLLFVTSDSIIAVKEFHHEISYRELKVMSTYYAAIFLLSLAAILI